LCGYAQAQDKSGGGNQSFHRVPQRWNLRVPRVIGT
jgi:hypothetical protein